MKSGVGDFAQDTVQPRAGKLKGWVKGGTRKYHVIDYLICLTILRVLWFIRTWAVFERDT